MLTTLAPMKWPRPVPSLMWRADYSDIRDRIRRTGKLDIGEPLWPDIPGAGEGGTQVSPFADAGTQPRKQRVYTRPAPEALALRRRQREEWKRRQQAWLEEAERGRRIAAEAARERAAADAALRERERAEAEAFWAAISPAFVGRPYLHVAVRQTIDLGVLAHDVVREPGSYWLPQDIVIAVQAILNQEGPR